MDRAQQPTNERAASLLQLNPLLFMRSIDGRHGTIIHWSIYPAATLASPIQLKISLLRLPQRSPSSEWKDELINRFDLSNAFPFSC